MLPNKIYKNFSIEIFKTFSLILFGLSIIALTVRAVNFLDLIVESGYPVSTYFYYSALNLFGIAPKFIPLSFLIALVIFILKHSQDGEFVILWTSGVRKIQIVNLFFLISVLILALYLLFSNLLTPYALNKSRKILSQDNFISFLPTVKTQQFSDSFKGFTFIVEEKFNNEIKNIFLHDKGNNLKGLSSNTTKDKNTTIVAEKGVIENEKMFLFNGQIISSLKDQNETDVIKFEQLSIDLSNLTTTTIKQPKLQETSTNILMRCLSNNSFSLGKFCENTKKEIPPTLSRRIVIPFYIPVISLVCSLLLIKTKKFYLNKISIYIYSFSIILFTELAVRYTGINFFMKYFFILFPFLLLLIFYILLTYKFSKESKVV